MNFQFCPKCGQALAEKEIGDEGLVPVCAPCDKAYFPFSYTCVLCLVVYEGNNVVLTQARADSAYGVVAGYVKEGEAVEDAAKREVEEEVGLSVTDMKYMGSYSYNKDTLMIKFACKVMERVIKKSDKEMLIA